MDGEGRGILWLTAIDVFDFCVTGNKREGIITPNANRSFRVYNVCFGTEKKSVEKVTVFCTNPQQYTYIHVFKCGCTMKQVNIYPAETTK